MRYRHDIQALLAVLVAGAIGTASAALQQHTFDRYQTILDRQPFGEIRPDRSAPGPAVPPPPPFTKDIKMCAITEDETGVQVGFVNAAVKPPKALVTAFDAQPGEMGPMCERELVTARAKARCFGKLNRPSDVPYEGTCSKYQMASPEAFRVKALRVAARAAGKGAMPWLAKVNNNEAEPAAIRSWAAELFLGLKAL